MELTPEVINALGFKGAGIYAVLKTLERLFGGTVDAIGDALTRFTETRLRNVGRVLENAAGKTDIDTPGEVPPRAAAAILEQAAWSDDEIVVEYLGGVLAGARTEDHTDDRAITYTAQIGRMSSYALRLHYLIYHAIHTHGIRSALNPGIADDRLKIRVFAPVSVLDNVFGPDDFLPMWEKVQHAGRTLVRESLLSIEGTLWGGPSVLPEWARQEGFGLCGGATMDGIDLYLWGLGRGNAPLSDIWNPDIEGIEDFPGVDGTVPSPDLAESAPS